METASRLSSELDRQARATAGVSLPQLDILLNVIESGQNSARMTDLAELLVVSRSGTTTELTNSKSAGCYNAIPPPTINAPSSSASQRKGSYSRAKPLLPNRYLMRPCLTASTKPNSPHCPTYWIESARRYDPPNVIHRGDLR